MKKLIFIILLLLIPSVSFGAAATMYVTPAGAGAKDGAAWASAMGYAEWEANMESGAEAGDIYYVAGGTYTLTSDMNMIADGTVNAYIKIIGVKSGTTNEPPVSSDYAYGTDRPLIDDGASNYQFLTDDYARIENLRFTNTGAVSLRADSWAIIINCKIDNETGNGVYFGGHIALVAGNECNSSTYCFGVSNNAIMVIDNYIHDTTTCITLADNAYTGNYVNNIFDTCTTGVNVASFQIQNFIGNHFYNCTTGISATDAELVSVINNVFDECTSPLTWTTNMTGNWNSYNSYDGDASSNDLVTNGLGNVDVDITFTNPASGDFTLPDSSAAEGVGFGPNSNIGVTGDYNWNIGVDQTDTQSGTSGGTSAYGFVN